MHIFFLGPAGTFTHEAARRYFPSAAESDMVGCASAAEVMRSLVAESGTRGVVPVENSVHGEVVPTLDALIFEFESVLAVGEVVLPVSFDWFGISPNVQPSRALSHPHALAQCRRFLQARGVEEHSTSSTAEACRLVAERGDPLLGAIASRDAGAKFSLHALSRGVEDHPGATTRFLVLSGQPTIEAAADRTMVALVPPDNSTGVMARFASIFADKGVNIYSVHSRPLRTGAGNYVFILTVGGSALVGPTHDALKKLLEVGFAVKFLGIYRSGGAAPAAPWPHMPGLMDADRFEALVGMLTPIGP
jgi:prephenate dehydratase